MKYLAKTGKVLLISSITVIAILFIASVILQDKITPLIINTINKNISAKIEAENSRLSFIRNFPKGSVELKNFIVLSAVEDDYSGLTTDTLLFAESFFLEFRLFDAFLGEYNIESLDVRSGVVKLLSDRHGNVNYNVAGKEPNEKSENVRINLRKINLSDVNVKYTDVRRKFSFASIINTGRISGSIAEKEYSLSSQADILLTQFIISETEPLKRMPGTVEINLHRNKDGLYLTESGLTVGKMKFGLTGSVDNENNPDLSIMADKIEIAELLKYITSGFTDKLSALSSAGTASAVCRIVNGVSGNIITNIDFQVGNGSISRNSVTLKNIALNGTFEYESRKGMELDLDRISIKTGRSAIEGSLHVDDLAKPLLQLQIIGTVYSDDIKQYMDYEKFSISGGNINLDVKGRVKMNNEFSLKNFSSFEPEGIITVKSLSLGFNDPLVEIENANGIIRLSDEIIAEDLSFDYEGQAITVNAGFRNLPDWIAGKPVMLFADGKVHFRKFMPEVFMSGSADGETNADFPGDMTLNINFSADNVIYKKLTSTNVEGLLTYKPRIFNFTELKMRALDGSISGDGFVVQNVNKSIISKGDFSLNGIDVKEAFTVFNNFGQDFIVAGNISGSLSGSVSVLLPMDRKFNINPRTITADGHYNLQKGALINFEPVKQLSDFIELSELENIHFETLENDFYIRNNILFIPQMDVKSTAADLTVNGRHSFDNSYEYHVRVLLSQILSKKRKNQRKPVTEFGAVEDDGLGRTALLLKVENKGQDVKVGYDIKALGNEVKEDLRKEKQTLKTILNDEYGWYSEDQEKLQVEQPQEKKRFNITWSETDPVPHEPEIIEEKQGTGLFRKR